MSHNLLKTLLIASLLCIPGGCAVNPVTGEHNFVMMSEAQEINLGKTYHAKVMQQYETYENTALQAYTRGIGEQLGTVSHRNNLIYRFTVLDSPIVNAFALPAGYIYITRGIMAYLNSEAELAGVLGHEIGHVTARHSVRQHAASTAAGIFGMVVAVKTGSRTISDLTQLFGGALVQGYGREHELESDRLGAEYLARSQYEPKNMLGVIGLLKNQEQFEIVRAKTEGREPQTYHGVFTSHPDNDQRLQEVIAAANQFKTTAPRSDNRAAYLEKINGMVFGESEKHGVTRNQTFYHSVLGFSVALPENWRIDNLPDRIILSKHSNDAFIQLTVDDQNKRITPENYLKEKVELRKPEDSRNLKINGLEAYTVTSLQDTKFGSRRMRFVVIYMNNRIYLFHGLSKNAEDFAVADKTFLDTASHFHSMTDAERAVAKPYRIKIITAEASTRYSLLAKQSPLPDHAEARLRLLNGQYPTGEPMPGSLLKIIE